MKLIAWSIFTLLGFSAFANPSAIDAPSVKQIGVAVEEHTTFLTPFLLFNQLLPNHFYYELRANFVHSYVSQSPPQPPVVSIKIPQSAVHGLNGGGGTGIFGYMFNLNSLVDFMPFIRVQVLPNTVSAYKDTYGNEISSVNYTAFSGGKMLMRINDVFSIYAQYFAGLQRSHLKCSGVFRSANSPKIDAIVSSLEFDLPYKITPSFKLMPYVQFNTSINYPNSHAKIPPLNISSLTGTNIVYAIRFEYKL